MENLKPQIIFIFIRKQWKCSHTTRMLPSWIVVWIDISQRCEADIGPCVCNACVTVYTVAPPRNKDPRHEWHSGLRVWWKAFSPYAPAFNGQEQVLFSSIIFLADIYISWTFFFSSRFWKRSLCSLALLCQRNAVVCWLCDSHWSKTNQLRNRYRMKLFNHCSNYQS